MNLDISDLQWLIILVVLLGAAIGTIVIIKVKKKKNIDDIKHDNYTLW